jgi:hypothetical protein
MASVTQLKNSFVTLAKIIDYGRMNKVIQVLINTNVENNVAD